MRLLYVKNGNSTFIRLDEEILRRNFRTRVISLNNRGRVVYFLHLLKLILLLAIRMPFTPVAFTRFADWHSAIMAFFCRLFGKRMVLVVGGYDASFLPEFGYGVYSRKTRGKWAKYALRNARLILPNNPSLVSNRNKYLPGIIRNGGIDFFVPHRKGSVRVLYNGYRTDFWVPATSPKKPGLVITVAYVDNIRTYRIKGLNDFIGAARQLPDLEFRLIGSGQEQLLTWEGELPANLAVMNALEPEVLLQHYQEAKVFCLLSLTEGMSNVLCEAMLCECVPVVSDVNFNAGLVGDSGFVVAQRDPSLIVEAIRKASEAAHDHGKKARKRIAENFSLERREKELVDSVRACFGVLKPSR